MTTQSDESSESLALYTLVQLRCHVTGNEERIGGYAPHIWLTMSCDRKRRGLGGYAPHIWLADPQSLDPNIGAYPPITHGSETGKMKKQTVNANFFLIFLKQLFYNDSLLMRMSSARPRGGSSIHWKNLQLRLGHLRYRRPGFFSERDVTSTRDLLQSHLISCVRKQKGDRGVCPHI